MNNLIIVGAGIYSLVAKEVAESMNCFDKISFIDDMCAEAPDGTKVIGTCADIVKLSEEYGNVIVAIGNPKVRLSLIEKIEAETPCRIATLISPHAYVSPSAKVMEGSVVEPMAVVHAGCVISRGCLISAGAVINHGGVCRNGVHIDCNATVAGNTVVPEGTKVCFNEVFKQN